MAVNSMTGFARVQGQDAGVAWTWEIKSVNSRGLDVRFKLPQGFDAIEVSAREVVSQAFKRGNINLGLTVQRIATATGVRINHALFEQLAEMVAGWQKHFPQLAPPSIDGLLALKGMMEPVEAEEDETTRERREAAVSETLRAAVKALAAMRAAEGSRLADVLEGHLAEILRLTGAVEACTALRPEVVRARLKAQVAALLEAAPALPEERLAQEVALLVAKGDVREELDRLKAHVAAARDMLHAGGAIGRRLDFLCQEFNREANTLCSKSGDVELTRIGLDLKAVIEQLREQVQNIE